MLVEIGVAALDLVGRLGDLEKRVVERVLKELRLLVHLLLAHQAVLVDQLLLVQIGHAALVALGDALVHERVGERRIVELVVAVLAEADQVDHDVLAELGAIVDGELGRLVDKLGMVAVDVNDRAVERLGQVAVEVARSE